MSDGFRQTQRGTAHLRIASPMHRAGRLHLLCDNTTQLFSVGGAASRFLNGATPGSLDRTTTAARPSAARCRPNDGSFAGPRQTSSSSAGSSIAARQFQRVGRGGTIGSDLFVTGTGVIISQAPETSPGRAQDLNTYPAYLTGHIST